MFADNVVTGCLWYLWGMDAIIYKNTEIKGDF
jgi:hypothetical protein